MQHPRRPPIGFELNLRGKSRGVKKKSYSAASVQQGRLGSLVAL